MNNSRNVAGHFLIAVFAFIALLLGAVFPETMPAFEIYLIFMAVVLLSGIYWEIVDYAENKGRRR